MTPLKARSAKLDRGEVPACPLGEAARSDACESVREVAAADGLNETEIVEALLYESAA